MASAILTTPQTPISQSSPCHFSCSPPKSPKKQSILTHISKLCSENGLKEALRALDFIKKEGNFPENTRIFNCLLHSIASERDLFLARKVYDHIITCNLHKSCYLGTKIVHTFVKCGSLVDAVDAFEAVQVKSLRSWSVILNGFCQNGLFDEALRFFSDFSETNVRADGYILSSVLRACGGLENSKLGREVHGFVYRGGYESDIFVSNCLIDMYGKCSLMDNARKVFNRMTDRDVVSWNSLMKVYTHKEDFDGFVGLVEEIEAGGMTPNLITWNTMIAGYAFYGRTKEALHCFFKMQSLGIRPDVVSCNALISALSQSGFFEEALELIRQMRNVGLEPDIASWTTLIKGYVNLGYLKEAMSMFSQLLCAGLLLDDFIFSIVLKACAGLEAINQGREIHGYMIRNGVMGAFETASLVHMYAKCGKLNHARNLLSNHNIVSWNSMISGYVRNRNVAEAKQLFQKLQSGCLKPDLASWNIMINCHAEEGNMDEALDLLSHMHSAGVSPDLVSWNSIIKGYTESKQIGDAMWLVNQMESLGNKQNTGSWNTLMSYNTNRGDGEEALRVAYLMKNHGIEPDLITYTCILRACSLLGALNLGRSVHGRVLRGNTIDNYTNSALLQMYIKSGDLGTAQKLFTSIRERTLVLWNGMISGLAESGKPREAHRLLKKIEVDKLNPNVISWTAVLSGYLKSGNADTALEIWCQMWQSKIQPDLVSITAALAACSKLTMLNGGREIHGFVITSGLEKKSSIQAALIAMYFKCGSIEEAACLFESAPRSSTLIWNTMISGYIMHGHEKLALSLLRRMQTEGIDANSLTFMSLISAFSGANLAAHDLNYCDLMLRDFALKHCQSHYAPMINNKMQEFK